MFKVPEKLIPYVDFEEGAIIPVNIPENLKDDFEIVRKEFIESNKEKLTDY